MTFAADSRSGSPSGEAWICEPYRRTSAMFTVYTFTVFFEANGFVKDRFVRQFSSAVNLKSAFEPSAVASQPGSAHDRSLPGHLISPPACEKEMGLVHSLP